MVRPVPPLVSVDERDESSLRRQGARDRGGQRGQKRADAERFLAETPAEFTVLYDPQGATPAAYAVRGMPSSYLIDTNGNVAAIEVGFRDERRAALEDRIRALLETRR